MTQWILDNAGALRGGSFRAEPRGGQRGMRLGLLGPEALDEELVAAGQNSAEERRRSVRGESHRG